MRASDLQTRLFTSAELAEKESAELGELLNLWLLFLDAGAKNFSARNSFSVFARQAQALLDSSRYLKSNLNKKLVLDNLAIKL